MDDIAIVNPAAALTVFAVAVVVLALCFWPKRGLLAWVLRLTRSTERVRMEDALKHLYMVEYQGRQASLASLAGVLEVSRMTTDAWCVVTSV